MDHAEFSIRRDLITSTAIRRRQKESFPHAAAGGDSATYPMWHVTCNERIVNSAHSCTGTHHASKWPSREVVLTVSRAIGRTSIRQQRRRGHPYRVLQTQSSSTIITSYPPRRHAPPTKGQILFRVENHPR